jgi:hypothetical protein
MENSNISPCKNYIIFKKSSKKRYQKILQENTISFLPWIYWPCLPRQGDCVWIHYREYSSLRDFYRPLGNNNNNNNNNNNYNRSIFFNMRIFET